MSRDEKWKEIFKNMKYIYLEFSENRIRGASYYELMECFILEYDVSVIAVSQVLLEHELDVYLKKHLIEPSDSYKKNIDIAYENNLINKDLKQLLDESRELRNIILHPDPNKDTRFLEDISTISITAVAEFLKASREPI